MVVKTFQSGLQYVINVNNDSHLQANYRQHLPRDVHVTQNLAPKCDQVIADDSYDNFGSCSVNQSQSKRKKRTM